MVVLFAERDGPFPRTGKIAVRAMPLAHAGGIVVRGVGGAVTDDELYEQT